MKTKQIKPGRKPRNISDTVVAALRAQGLSVRQIAEELGEARSTVGRRVQALDRARGASEVRQEEAHEGTKNEAA